MKGIIIPLTEEEHEARLRAIIREELQNYSSQKQEIIYKTRKEAASKLHISLPTLNELTKKGIIKGYRLNGRVLYRDDELDAALTEVQPLKYRR
ncbi:helix-turn-helix domain-containing protein [Draconibacterium sp. IB214405]|uniref:helix-turn-helix domain-containing protein n=1 Tax=Draconibacterium sp. IB214405 TaxID=3097352 RepID=UPI002A117945|nr:helix-turn-helix domain-containing protein [Draconibacterium sp. IB214405]MDX8340549.1 helix-turn-helix domain-containing protein [Draconibacterium sp. IB214405]